MNKRLMSLLTSGVAILTLCACTNSSSSKGSSTPVTPKEGEYKEFDFKGQGYLDKDYLALKKMFYTLSVGESTSISVESLPTSYALNSLEFESKDSSVVSVNEEGKLTAIKKGIADVEVRTKDGSYSNKVRVVVSQSSTKEGCQDVINSLDNVYKDESYVSAKRVVRYEYSSQLYYCEGVVDHGMEGFEVIAYDSDEGYFYLEGPTLYHKTPHGTPELSDGKWIMYPISYGIKTRLVHITPTSKNYFDINTAAYNNDFDRSTRDILNFFFVSGETIIDDLLSDFDGKEDFYDFQKYNDTKYHSVDSTSLGFTYHQERNDTVSADEEINKIDVPAETPYTEIMDIALVNRSNRNVGYEVNASTLYNRDGKAWNLASYRSQYFSDDFELEKIQNPKDNGFTLVDSLSDL